MTSPSPPPPTEGLPEEIVKAIEALEIAAHVLGGNFLSMQDADEADHAACESRSTLDATILHHLSAARARAERAEKALEPFVRHADLYADWLRRGIAPNPRNEAFEAARAALSQGEETSA